MKKFFKNIISKITKFKAKNKFKNKKNKKDSKDNDINVISFSKKSKNEILIEYARNKSIFERREKFTLIFTGLFASITFFSDKLNDTVYSVLNGLKGYLIEEKYIATYLKYAPTILLIFIVFLIIFFLRRYVKNTYEYRERVVILEELLKGKEKKDEK